MGKACSWIYLNSTQGYRIIRFWNHQIMNEMQAVKRAIEAELGM